MTAIRGYVFDAHGTLLDVHSVVEAGRPRAILSNGAPAMLEAAGRSSGLARHLEHVISVARVKRHKPSPRVYALGPATLGIPAGELLFVSSNAWDVAGAKAFGYRVAWCNRQGAPEEELGARADVVVGGLDELPREPNFR